MRRVFALCLIILFFTNTVIAKESDSNELIDIATMILENNLQIQEWEVTMKEHRDATHLQEMVQDLSNSYSVTKHENENSIIYSVKDTHKEGTINVNYNVIFPKDNRYESELVITINGSSWDENIESSYVNLMSVLTGKFFTDNIKIFSCMSTRASAIIKNDNIVENITEKLKISHKETYNDTLKPTKDAEYIYGYSPLWGQKITIQDKPVNVQIVSQTLGSGDVQLTIGTPILINEY
ncbi:YwmB family TATA-box binding protein [Ornithinibacillus californiensis]|uniref:YwmB family TATA-box binding protein n=1 Tax=Ornithinibacillus californiensis TaxID=161536 RepID=UPI00064DB427|nr:YwmB family TATA-box binding protein [Ornithinibacillus californiensis]